MHLQLFIVRHSEFLFNSTSSMQYLKVHFLLQNCRCEGRLKMKNWVQREILMGFLFKISNTIRLNEMRWNLKELCSILQKRRCKNLVLIYSKFISRNTFIWMHSFLVSCIIHKFPALLLRTSWVTCIEPLFGFWQHEISLEPKAKSFRSCVRGFCPVTDACLQTHRQLT